MRVPPDFFVWALWRRRGAIRADRPASLKKAIPPWWFVEYRRRGYKPILKPPVVVPEPEPPTPPVVLPPLRVMFTAWDPILAKDRPEGWTIAVSADPAYRDAVRLAIPRLHGRLVAWCDCDQTPAAEAIALMQTFCLHGWIGQAETSLQYAHAIAAGATTIVGNASALTPEQLADATARARSGKLTWLQEAYWGDGYPAPSKVSAQGIPAAGLVIGVYSGTRPRTPDDYIRDLPSLEGTYSEYLREGRA